MTKGGFSSRPKWNYLDGHWIRYDALFTGLLDRGICLEAAPSLVTNHFVV